MSSRASSSLCALPSPEETELSGVIATTALGGPLSELRVRCASSQACRFRDSISTCSARPWTKQTCSLLIMSSRASSSLCALLSPEVCGRQVLVSFLLKFLRRSPRPIHTGVSPGSLRGSTGSHEGPSSAAVDRGTALSGVGAQFLDAIGHLLVFRRPRQLEKPSSGSWRRFLSAPARVLGGGLLGGVLLDDSLLRLTTSVSCVYLPQRNAQHLVGIVYFLSGL